MVRYVLVWSKKGKLPEQAEFVKHHHPNKVILGHRVKVKVIVWPMLNVLDTKNMNIDYKQCTL